MTDRRGDRFQVIDIGVEVAFDCPADYPVNFNLPPDKGAVACRSVEYRVQDLARRDFTDLLGAECWCRAQAIGERPRGDARAGLADINTRRQEALIKRRAEVNRAAANFGWVKDRQANAIARQLQRGTADPTLPKEEPVAVEILA